MDPQKERGSKKYRCNWMGCPLTFAKPSLLRAHLDGVHLTTERLNADCRVPGGRWEEWLRVHDPEYSVVTDSWVAALPSGAYSSSQSTPSSSRSRLLSQDALHLRRDTTPSTSHQSPVRLVTPEQRTRLQPSKASFTGFSALDTPIQAARLNGAVENSPALSVLVRRSNGSSLPASPQLHTPSESSSDESPRKRRRLSPNDESSPTPEGPYDQQSSKGSQNSYEQGQNAYPDDSDDSFPEFLPSQDVVSKTVHVAPSAEASLSFEASADLSQASSADVELQLTQSIELELRVASTGRALSPAEPDGLEKPRPQMEGMPNAQPPLDDSLTEPESQSQDNPPPQLAAPTGDQAPSTARSTRQSPEAQRGDEDGIPSSNISPGHSQQPIEYYSPIHDPPSYQQQHSESGSHPETLSSVSVQQHQVESFNYFEEQEKEKEKVQEQESQPEEVEVDLHPPSDSPRIEEHQASEASQGPRRSSRLRSTSAASSIASSSAKAPRSSKPQSQTINHSRSRSRSVSASTKGKGKATEVKSGKSKRAHNGELITQPRVETIVEEGDIDTNGVGSTSGEPGNAQAVMSPTTAPSRQPSSGTATKSKVPIPRLGRGRGRGRGLSQSRSFTSHSQSQSQDEPAVPPSNDHDHNHHQLRSQPPSPSPSQSSHSHPHSPRAPSPDLPGPTLEERMALIKPPKHWDLATAEDNKDDDDDDQGGFSQVQLLTQAPYNYSSPTQSQIQTWSES
ncbi:hypothetical protein BC629DRAFT_435076 [Irpex lacteus]|nr:hypothetical protein BC629DRAFT_435076 [Irpex lacteus]